MTQYSQGQAASPVSSHRWIKSVGLAIALGIAYFLAARLSLLLLTKPDGVAVFWPAAGVSAGVLISLGPRTRLPVMVGTMAATVAANLLGDRNIWSAIVFALCNAGEAVLVAALIENYFGPSFSLDRLRNVIGLVAATITVTAISGIGGTLGFDLFHNSQASILTIWLHWFASDALGIITVAPLLIGLVSAIRDPPQHSEVIEGAVALVMLTIVSGLIVLLPREPWAAVVPTASLFPLLLWVTARCQPVFAAAAAFIVALTVVWTTTFGIGILGDPSLSITQRILCAQASILTASLCALVLAALFAERKANEARLARSSLILERERHNKLMTLQAIVSSIAHEMKQPLTSIAANGGAALALLGKMPPDVQEARASLTDIVDDSHRASDSLDGIRSLLREVDEQRRPIDVNEMVLEVLHSVHEELAEHGIATVHELAPKMPLVDANRSQLIQVIHNLVHNAIQAMETSDRNRVLRVRTGVRGPDAIVLEVQDSGAGVDPQELGTIFDAFVTTKKDGMGLGLAICRTIIERHGGQLSASSDGENGALFQFVLPTQSVNKDAARAQ